MHVANNLAEFNSVKSTGRDTKQWNAFVCAALLESKSKEARRRYTSAAFLLGTGGFFVFGARGANSKPTLPLSNFR